MDEFEKNEMNGESSEKGEAIGSSEARNTNAPSGWSYSANTNQYVSWDGSSDQSGAQQSRQNSGNQQNQPPRREYGTQYLSLIHI